ncbi:MAG: helix-turn-helix transcriptional regulator [Cyclobacterium sp.]|uniref:AraC family transcriptional regulator n=1 Tax=unclassified Cyclobacterium TaxID=2615055 RepID=UPI0013D52316|nr:helix-turn-helix transcriptional regulator [Cyclobacterium sp. SYSU L10401]
MQNETKFIGTKNKIELDLILKITKMKPVIKPTKPHRHQGYHELIFLSKGSGQHTVGNQVHEVFPPMGFYLNLGQVHCWDFSKIPEGFVILFKEDALTAYPRALSNLYRINEKFKLPRNEDALMNMLHLFYNDFKNGEHMELLSAHLNAIIYKTLHLPHHTENIHPNVVDEFSLFKRLINENYLQIKNADEYANLMHISIRKLNQISREAAGSTAIEVIRERILIEAKNLLTHTSLSVNEVAFQLNFSDASNFIKFFKSQTTLTPSEYRSKL